MMEVNDDLIDAVRAKPVDVPQEDGSAHHGNHALGPVGGEGPEAGPEARREQHGLHAWATATEAPDAADA